MRLSFFLLISFLILPSRDTHAAETTKHKVVKYKKHTDLDFSEQTVQGKIRSPDVFYIFQRKRSEGPQIVSTPRELNSLRRETRKTLEGQL